MTETIGYLGSIVVAVSLLMRNIYKLRVVNLVGSLLFVIYGYMISAPAVWSVNLFIAFVDLYYIYELKKKSHLFEFIQLGYNDIVKNFINFHINDIIKYFPNIKFLKLEELSYYVIVRNFVIVGVFGYKDIDNKNIEVCIDYISPNWRDFKNAINFFSYLSSQEKFRNKVFHVESYNISHSKYLRSIGFKEYSKNKFMLQI